MQYHSYIASLVSNLSGCQLGKTTVTTKSTYHVYFIGLWSIVLVHYRSITVGRKVAYSIISTFLDQLLLNQPTKDFYQQSPFLNTED